MPLTKRFSQNSGKSGVRVPFPVRSRIKPIRWLKQQEPFRLAPVLGDFCAVSHQCNACASTRQRLFSQPPYEIAMREGAQPYDRAPEALLAGFVEIEARLEWQAFERRAHGIALHLERPGRQAERFHLS